MTASLPHPGQRTPSGQRCWRTSAKHLASSNSSERLTRSDEGMTARAPCATAAADQPPASSQQKPHATATRSPASQHPGSQQEPPPKPPDKPRRQGGPDLRGSEKPRDGRSRLRRYARLEGRSASPSPPERPGTRPSR